MQLFNLITNSYDEFVKQYPDYYDFLRCREAEDRERFRIAYLASKKQGRWSEIFFAKRKRALAHKFWARSSSGVYLNKRRGLV